MELVQAIPSLPVRHIDASVAFYREKLGFAVKHQDAGVAILLRDAVELHLWEASDEAWRDRAGSSPVISGAESFIAGTSGCRMCVAGVQALHAELQPLGVVHPRGQINDKPWGTREFSVLDIDGNALTFFERI